MEENQLIIHERQEQPVQVFDNMKGYFWEFWENFRWRKSKFRDFWLVKAQTD